MPPRTWRTRIDCDHSHTLYQFIIGTGLAAPPQNTFYMASRAVMDSNNQKEYNYHVLLEEWYHLDVLKEVRAYCVPSITQKYNERCTLPHIKTDHRVGGRGRSGTESRSPVFQVHHLLKRVISINLQFLVTFFPQQLSFNLSIHYTCCSFFFLNF